MAVLKHKCDQNDILAIKITIKKATNYFLNLLNNKYLNGNLSKILFFNTMQWLANKVLNMVVWVGVVLGFIFKEDKIKRKKTDSDWPQYFLIIDAIFLMKYLGGYRELWLGYVVIFKETELLALERHLRNLIKCI